MKRHLNIRILLSVIILLVPTSYLFADDVKSGEKLSLHQLSDSLYQ